MIDDGLLEAVRKTPEFFGNSLFFPLQRECEVIHIRAVARLNAQTKQLNHSNTVYGKSPLQIPNRRRHR